MALDKGEYASLNSADDLHLATARSAIFLVAYRLVRLGYFLGVQKSILFPRKVVPYLGFLADSSREVFCLKSKKKEKFLDLVRGILKNSMVTVKTLQCLVGKCVSFSLAVPAAQLFTRQMFVQSVKCLPVDTLMTLIFAFVSDVGTRESLQRRLLSTTLKW